MGKGAICFVPPPLGGGGQEAVSTQAEYALAVEPQQVVLGEGEAADRHPAFYPGVRAMPVVSVQPDWELFGSTIRVRVGRSIGPFAQRGLNEAFGLAVGLGRVGPGADVLEVEIAAGVAEVEGSVAGAVVGHDPFEGEGEALVVGEGGFEEGDGATLLLVGEDLREGQARGVVDADVDELPADAAGVALALAIP